MTSEPDIARPTIALERGSAIVSAAVAALGVLAFGWSSFIVVGLYWLENVAIGIFTLARMLTAWSLGGGRAGGAVGVVFLLGFFSVHYGMFCYGHGMFLIGLLGGPAAQSMAGTPDPLAVVLQAVLTESIGWVALAAVVLFVASDFARWIIEARRSPPRPNDLMLAPYRRIVVLHIALLGGAMLMQVFGLPQAAALLLVALKLVFDLREVRRPFTFAWRRR